MTQKSHTRSETLPSRPERRQRPKPSDQQGTGSSPGPRQQLLQPSLSPTETGSAKNTESTFLDSSQPLRKNITTSSSTTTEQSVNASPCGETCFLPTSPTLGTYEYSSSTCEAPTLGSKRKRPADDVHQGVQVTHACDGTKGLAPQRQSAASTSTSALIVATRDIPMA